MLFWKITRSHTDSNSRSDFQNFKYIYKMAVALTAAQKSTFRKSRTAPELFFALTTISQQIVHPDHKRIEYR